MKLRELEIENYGIFAGEHFEFDTRFQLIHGRNEAGKSTLLELIRDVLFGFPRQCRYAFPHHQGDVAASALIVLSSGAQIRFRRCKGSKRSVTGQVLPDGDKVDAQDLSRRLGQAGVELFRNVFGFTLDELAAGERSLRTANLSEALFGGAIGGLSNVQRLKDSLRKEHETLYSKSSHARKPTINQLVQQIRDQQKSLQAAIVKPRVYRELTAKLTSNQNEHAHLKDRLQQMRRQRARKQRLHDALPKWRDLRHAEKGLEFLRVPDAFPLDGIQQLRGLQERLRDSALETSALESKLEANKNEVATVLLFPELLLCEAEIRQLQHQVGKIANCRSDIPIRQQEADSNRDQALGLIRDIDPQWPLDRLSQFPAALPMRETFETMRDEAEQLKHRRTELKAARRRVARDIKSLKEKREPLKSIQRSPALEDVVARRPQYETDLVLRGDLQQEAERVEAEIRTQHTKLEGPLGQDLNLNRIHELPVPMEEAVVDFREQFEMRSKALELAQQRTKDRRGALADREAQMESLESAQRIPGREELVMCRTRRDNLWQLIRKKYVLEKSIQEDLRKWPIPDGESLPDAFQREMRGADDVADERQAKAELVARHEQLIAEIEQLKNQAEAAESEVEECQKAWDDLDGRWRQRWASCHVRPLSPKEMLQWLHRHGELLEKLEEQTVTHQKLRDVDARIGDVEDDLRSALADIEGPVSQLFRLADERVELARKAETELDTFSAQLAERQHEMKQLDVELQELDRGQDDWNTRWKDALTSSGLPTEYTVQMATKIFRQIGQAQQKMHEVSSFEQRVSEMTVELKDFEGQVQHLCQQVASDLLVYPAEDGAIELNRRLDEARQAEGDHARLLKEQKRLRSDLNSRCDQQHEIKEMINSLFAAAEVDCEADFQAMSDRIARRKELQDRRDALTLQIQTLCGADDFEAFQSELKSADEESLVREIEQIDEAIEMSDAQLHAVAEQIGSGRQQLNQFETSKDALRIQMEIESSRSKLSAAVDRWAPLVLAEKVIDNCLERFEREHQPALLQDVAELFSRMTQGRYVEIQRKLDDQGTLIVKTPSGEAKEPDQLSRGTREQLYLAIRLAYVRRYSSKSEPLPLIMDDVLVNFDDVRARSTLEVLLDVSDTLQIVFLTCHQSVVDLIHGVQPGVACIDLSAARPAELAMS